MASIIVDIKEIVTEINGEIARVQPESEIRVVGFFDLSRSVDMKVIHGHEIGTEAALRFVAAAARLVGLVGGKVVQKFGDGILCTFVSAVDACKAALNVKAMAYELDLQSSCGLTLGQLSSYSRPDGIEELFGEAVDRCARIQALASPGQVLMDDTLLKVVRSHLASLPEVLVGSGFEVEAKGVGPLRLHELSTHELRLVGRIATPFLVHAGGRPPVREMVQFMQHAQHEIIEIGTGLTSFAKYFTGMRADEFRDPLRQMLKRGVTLKCFALDPDYEPGMAYLHEQGDRHYAQEMESARRLIMAERRECSSLGYHGKIEFYLYRRIPSFYCLCVDPEDLANGRMEFSPYLGGHFRSAYPVQQLSRQSYPDLYEKYLTSIELVTRTAVRVTS